MPTSFRTRLVLTLGPICRLGLVTLALAVLVAGCGPQPASTTVPSAAAPLASFTQNSVQVDIRLERGADQQAVLAATYTPLEDGFHVYSKDLPRQGVDGVGRPTLLELAPGSKIQARGVLSESAAPKSLNADNPVLMVYPAGPVTLRLPVTLPAGSAEVDDQVTVTYMTCNATECRPPVVAKAVTVRVPGAGS